MKKIVSALLAIMMLGQVAFAKNLQTHVTEKYPSYIVDNMFDYAAFMKAFNESNLPTDPDQPTVIPAPVTTTVRVNNEGSYGAHPASNVLNSGDPAKNSFDYKAELDMTQVKAAFEAMYALACLKITDPALLNQFLSSKVTGEFTVKVAYDPSLTLDSSATFDLKQNGAAPALFTEVSHNVTSNPAQFIYKVVDGVTVEDLYNNKEDWFKNLYMEISNVSTAVMGQTLSVTVSMTEASTIFNDETDTPADYAKITYSSDPVMDPATAVVYVPSPSGGSPYYPPKAFTIVDDVKTEVTVDVTGLTYYVNIDEIERPVKEGHTFDGWYLDVGYTNPVSGTIQIKRNTYLYGRFIPSDNPIPDAFTVVDGTSSRVPVNTDGEIHYVDIDGIEIPTKEGFAFNGWYLDPYFTEPVSGVISITEDTYIYPQFINTVAPSTLISDEHILYIVGYPDGEVKPNGLITREEVAAAFYRLLEPTYRTSIETTTHSFPDVAQTRWSNEEIATLANGGYIVGDEKGYFNPSKPITRAEFVTIATKFAELNEVPETNIFSDITGHWAEEYILRATNDQHWITGYEDHTFRPNNYITRAEAMTIINKMLVRYGDVSSAHAMQWPDLSKDDWYYSNVIEATTEHDYTRNADGWNETWSFGTGVTDEVIDSVSGSHITD